MDPTEEILRMSIPLAILVPIIAGIVYGIIKYFSSDAVRAPSFKKILLWSGGVFLGWVAIVVILVQLPKMPENYQHVFSILLGLVALFFVIRFVIKAIKNNTYIPPPEAEADASKKVAAGIFGILLGGLGIHKFYLGYSLEGVIMLFVSIAVGFFTLGVATAIMCIISLIEGILYLTASDEKFIKTYVLQKQGWF